MRTLLSFALLGLLFAGWLYYWWKARAIGVYWLYIFFVMVFWPFGAIVGIYWAIEDLYMYYFGKPLIKKTDDKDSKYSLKE